MAPDVISREKAEEILSPHIADLVGVLQAGWDDWKDLTQKVPGKVAVQGRRTRASWVHDAMAQEALRRFASKEEVHVSESRGFLTITFANMVILRFRKFQGKRLRTSGIPTQQRIDFETQQLHLDGMTVTSVVAGYLVDELEQELARLAVTCPFGGDNVWVIDLEIPGSGTAEVVPVAPKAPSSTPPVVVESARPAKVTRPPERN